MSYHEETGPIVREAERLARRHDRSYSLILYRGQESYRQDGSVDNAIKEMREYCHAKRALPVA